ncbi:protein of unknown function [Thermococcus camini]|uniref:Uncharacterized protein n=1 Tax=Thermococcus camini TaxID=2016373 RepID=A0A7G2DDN1_9EURY|nr:protein of unknown function [Thermococcus camini]
MVLIEQGIEQLDFRLRQCIFCH